MFYFSRYIRLRQFAFSLPLARFFAVRDCRFRELAQTNLKVGDDSEFLFNLFCNGYRINPPRASDAVTYTNKRKVS